MNDEQVDDAHAILDREGVPRDGPFAPLTLADRVEYILNQAKSMRSMYHTLRAAIAVHHGQKADDRCIEDDDKLYAAAGLPPCDRRVGDKEAMLANCRRFIENRCEGGHWPSYADLEKELKARGEILDEIQAKAGATSWLGVVKKIEEMEEMIVGNAKTFNAETAHHQQLLACKDEALGVFADPKMWLAPDNESNDWAWRGIDVYANPVAFAQREVDRICPNDSMGSVTHTTTE